MNVSRYRLTAQSALVSLEGTVMGVMYEARCNNQEPLKPAKISRYLDIPVYNRKNNYAFLIVQDILYRLELEDLVRQLGKGGPWVLTDKAIRKLEEN